MQLLCGGVVLLVLSAVAGDDDRTAFVALADDLEEQVGSALMSPHKETEGE